MINILSIDWDYFIDATSSERRRMFPDGGNENLAPFLKSVIWAGLYAANESLEGIKALDTVELSDAIVTCSIMDVKAMMADSHKYIYEFIKENVPVTEELNLVNVDYHHDIYNVDEKNIHAGNWLSHIMKEYPESSFYTWIARKDSEAEDVLGNKNLRIRYEDFSELWGSEWDLVYVCRSGMWSPPHLDEQFIRTFSWMTNEFYIKIQKGILDSRYTESFQSEVLMDRKMRSQLMETMEKNDE